MSTRPRLVTLDALRGFTVAAMIVVNTPGTWAAIFPPLRHAEWHGLTPTDLVFPFFLFIVGVSIALAYGTERDAPPPTGRRRKVLWRAVKIFALGVFLNLWPNFDWADVRVAGVLQRIGLVFAVVALLHLTCRTRTLVSVLIIILLGYWALLAWVPVPRDAVIEQALTSGQVERAHGASVAVAVAPRDSMTIEPNLEPGTNWAAWLDRRALPGQFYEVTWDPEGWVSTVPSIATALLGLLTGLLLQRVGAARDRLVWLTLGGLLALSLGYAWSLAFPLNKNLWTSSFVLVAAGWALLVFAAMFWLIEVKGLRRWAFPGVVLGSNAITAYVLAAMLTVVAYGNGWFGDSPADRFLQAGATLGVSPELASLLFALGYTLVIFVPLWLMYRRRIFLRL